MSVQHLVTSGCSFSDNKMEVLTWPYYLSQANNWSLYNKAHQGVSNTYICRSIIYQIELLLSDGISSDEILVIPMWSGIDRKSLFISDLETIDFNKISTDCVDYYGTEKNKHAYVYKKSSAFVEHASIPILELLGEEKYNFVKQSFNYFTMEYLSLLSYEMFFHLQMYCNIKKINLVNLTFGDILHYPNNAFKGKQYINLSNNKLTVDTYPRLKHIYNNINFDNWCFYKDTKGLFEFASDLNSLDDTYHPTSIAQQKYTETVLQPWLKQKNII